MSTTDLTKFPDGPNIGGQAQKGGDAPSPLKAQIIGVPNEARGSSTPVRIAGEVIRADDKGNVRIKTPSGTIDVQIAKAEGKTLQKGQFVEINIPPERPNSGSKAPSGNTTESAAERHTAREVKITVRRAPPTEGKAAENPPASTQDISTKNQNTNAQSQSAPPPQSTDYPHVTLPATPVRMEQVPADMLEQITLPPQQKLEVKLQVITANISSEQAQALQSLMTPSAQGALPTPQYSQPVQTTLEPAAQNMIAQASAQILPTLTVMNTGSGTAPPPLAILTQPSFAVLTPAPIIATQTAAPTSLQNIPNSVSFIQATSTPAAGLMGQEAPIQAPLGAITIAMPNIGVKMQNQIAFRAAPLSQMAFTPPAPIPELPLQSALLTDISAPQVSLFQPDEAAAKFDRFAPNIDAPKAAQNMQAGETRAVFSGLTADKLPVVSFPATGNFTATNLAEMQNFVLHFPLPGDIPIGAELSLQTQGAASSITQSTMTSPAQIITTNVHALSYGLPPIPAYFQSPESWPVMNDILQTLQAQSAQGAQAMSALTASPATAPSQIGPAALFFLAAVKGGDIQSWLGEKAIETLRKAGRGDILSRLGSESATLSRMSRDAPAGEWRAISLPFMAEQDIQKIAFYYKHDYPDDNGEDDQGEKRTRFIFDISLSNMGMVQLDGMHKGQKLDMVLRTQEPFSQAARAAMKQIYIQSLELTSLHGEISFHSRPEQWVKVPLKTEGQSINT